MNFEFNETQQAGFLALREMVQSEIAPYAQELDNASDARRTEVVRASIRKLGQAGFLKAAHAPQTGGDGKTLIEWTRLAEEVARACPSTYLTAMTSSMAACDPIATFGSEAQKRNFVMPCLRGETVGAFALVEAEAGANPAAVQTHAQRTAKGWSLSGTKAYATNAPIADFFIVAARTTPEGGEGGMSLFAVRADAPGLVRTGRIETMGHRGAAIGGIMLNGCEVGEDALIGKENAGFEYAMHATQLARLGTAVGALGIGLACLEVSLDHSRRRISFGSKIIKYQEVSFKLAQMRMLTDVSRLLVEYAAYSLDEKLEDAATSVSCAKIQATEAAAKISHMAVQIFGSHGYMRGTPAERLYRDARLGEIIWGTSELQRVALARDMLAKV